VNVGVDPLKHHRDLNIHMTTQRTDSLSYAGVRENLVLTLDQVTLNSWNEVSVARYAGSDALLDCMVAYLQALAANAPAPRLRVRCFCHNRATAIAQRVEALLIEAQRLLQLGQGYRFVLQVQQRYHVLALTYGQVSHTAADTLRALVAVLSQERSSYSPLQLDHSALQEHELSLLLPQGQPGCVQVFFRQQGDWAQVYVLDELNALWQRRLPFHDENSLLLPLQRFLESILHRREALQPAQQPVQVRYHQITPAGAGQARRLEPWMAPADGLDRGYYAVQAIVGRHGVTLYCDQKEFSTLEYGDQLYAAAAAHIIGRRHQQQRYRCYITDLDLGPTPASTQLYLHHKSDLEDALAAAVAAA
jgi:adenylate cyclase class 1